MKKILSVLLSLMMLLPLTASASAAYGSAYGSYGPYSGYSSYSAPAPAPTPTPTPVPAGEYLENLDAESFFEALKQSETVSDENTSEKDGVIRCTAEIGKIAVDLASVNKDGKLSCLHLEDINATARHDLFYKAVRLMTGGQEFDTSKSWISSHLYQDGDLQLGDAVLLMRHTDKGMLDLYVFDDISYDRFQAGDDPYSAVQDSESSDSSQSVSSVSSETANRDGDSTSYAGARNSSASTSAFTNQYGTPTTKCAHPGCSNMIASSGDTNCCTVHSNKCGNCGKYIDEDALFCMDCLTASVTGSSGSGSFTNKYGTPTTKCAHPGCSNPIASSGDTNCCTVHSNRCGNCGKYIDEDAMYCLDCISASLTGSSGSGSFTNKYGSSTTKCAHPGCNNPVASSGDTNCCTVHSNRCASCGKYIDEDAMYCMDCISSAITGSSGSSKSSGSGSGSYGSSGSSGNTMNGYEMPVAGESFSDYLKRVDPELYDSVNEQYETAIANGW